MPIQTFRPAKTKRNFPQAEKSSREDEQVIIRRQKPPCPCLNRQIKNKPLRIPVTSENNKT